MKYDFTTVLDRTGRDALAVEVIPSYSDAGSAGHNAFRARSHSSIFLL